MMETGWVKVSSTDVKDLHYQYQKEKEEEKPEPGTCINIIIKFILFAGNYDYFGGANCYCIISKDRQSILAI